MASALQAWERQPGESSPAFAAFAIYRDLGPHRSLEKAYRQYKPGVAQLSGQWSEWSATHRWLERALAYDDYCDAERRRARERKLRELEERRADFEIAKQDALQKWVDELDGELRAALTEGYTETEEEFVKDEAGQLVPIKRTTKVKFPSHSAFARLLLARHETFRIAVEGPRRDPASKANSGSDQKPGSAAGGEFVWVKPAPEDDGSSPEKS